MMSKAVFYSRLALAVLILLTLAFTFSQSLLPPEESDKVSTGVSDAIEPVVPSDTPVGSYVHTNLRKIAHFVEFAALGLEIALFVILYLPAWGAPLHARLRYIACSYLIAPLTALADETVQILTGRGPSVIDIWIDVAGFCSLATLSYLIYLAVTLTVRHTAGIRNTAHENR